MPELRIPLFTCLLVITLLAPSACWEHAQDWGVPPEELPLCWMSLDVNEASPAHLDFVLVIDDASGMAALQEALAAEAAAIWYRLADPSRVPGGPDLHVGVVSANLGAGRFPWVAGCARTGGDQGRLQVPEGCTQVLGAPYLVDVTPRGCVIEHTADDEYRHACTQAHCDRSAPEPTFLVEDSRVGPRCRNFAGPADEALSCLVRLGAQGCAFPQPLEALRLALEHPDNIGFIRDEARLLVTFVSQQDDCSARDDAVFDPGPGSPGDPLGPPGRFRCFEQGVTCDVNDRTTPGPRTGCAARDDDRSLLHPIARYQDALLALKDRQRIVITAIAGPPEPVSVEVSADASGMPSLTPSCSAGGVEALPAVRIAALVSAFATPEDLLWAYRPACGEDLGLVVEGGRSHVWTLWDFLCFPAPLRGCTDPGAVDDQAGNDGCLPTCDVDEVQRAGTADEVRVPVVPCLEVCPEGLCPGNRDPAAAYQGGRPAVAADPRMHVPVDPFLPVAACWLAAHDPGCPESASPRFVRRDLPAPRSWFSLSCRCVFPESRCADGVDNDGDGRVDGTDPDCQ